ncbi:MAG: hypothetical protein AAF968_08720, partial [Pseudomonadota bacterium]
ASWNILLRPFKGGKPQPVMARISRGRPKRGDAADGFIRPLVESEHLELDDLVLETREWLLDAVIRSRSQRGRKRIAQTKLAVVLQGSTARVRGSSPQLIPPQGRPL